MTHIAALLVLAPLGGCAGQESDDPEIDIPRHAVDSGSRTDTDPEGDPEPQTPACSEIAQDLLGELSSAQHCDVDADCGQILSGTSCGCTRELVARVDADTSEIRGLIDDANTLDCDVGLGSACDCPEADGFACVSRKCTWNYVEPEPDPGGD